MSGRTDFLRAVGFGVARDHPRNPRLDLCPAVTWRSEMEAAVEHLVGAIRPEPSPPAPAAAPDALIRDQHR